MNRREFSKLSTWGLAAATLPRAEARFAALPAPSAQAGEQQNGSRGAWFKEARYGRFIHFGLYALLGRAEWAMFLE